MFHSEKKASQLIDFESISFGKDNHLSATDIDGLVEYKNKAYVFYEVKYGDTVTTKGQRIALERLCDDLSKTGKQVLLIICSHLVKDHKKKISLGDCKVTSYYYCGKYYKPKNMNVKTCMKRFILNKVNPNEKFSY